MVVQVSAFAAVTAVKVVEPMAILARVAVKAEVVMDTVGLVAATEEVKVIARLVAMVAEHKILRCAPDSRGDRCCHGVAAICSLTAQTQLHML